MSRVGKRPVHIKKGMEVKIDGSIISVKKGDIEKKLETYNRVKIEINKDSVQFSQVDNSKESSAFFGTYRALFANIIIGLDTGFKKTLKINGVGYRANINNKVLTLQLGFSHDIIFNIPDEIKIELEKDLIHISGNDKQIVGQVAAKIRAFRPPEPYKGKGIKYIDETIIRKSGKTSGK